MPDQEDTKKETTAADDCVVEEADKESFPASDAPARTVVTGIKEKPLEPEELSQVDEAQPTKTSA